MKIITPTDGNLIIWRERKIVSEKLYTPDNFDESVLEQLPIAEAKALEEEWNKEAEQQAAEGAENG